MKKIRQTLIVLVFLIGYISNGQSQSRRVVKGKIGFACDDTGRSSVSVQKISKLIEESKDESILKLIDSRNPAHQFLGVLLVEAFAESGRVELTKEVKDKISKIYASEKVVEVCEGCMYSTNVTLNKLLDKKKQHRMNKSAKTWLKTKIKNNK